MRKTKIKFVVFCNQMIGEVRPAWSIQECLDGLTKRQKQFWSNIMWRDAEGRTMNFHKEFLEQGMTNDEIIDDWIWNTSADEQEQPIHVLNPNRFATAGTIEL